MRQRKRLFSALLLLAILVVGGLALFSRPEGAVLAGPLEFTFSADVAAPAAYGIPWEAFASGGSLTASSASYTMQSTIGQPATGSSQSASYEMCSGFWCRIQKVLWSIFLPVVNRFQP
jgi:hypothetical protein